MAIRDLVNSEKERILTRSVPGRRTGPYSLIALSTCALLNLIFGIVILNINILTLEIPYNSNLSIPIEFTNNNLNIYIQLAGFYQSYLGYAKSISYNQLKGKATMDVSDCYPLEGGDRIYYPCGLIANSYFQDEISILDSDGNNVISVDDIAWPSERNLIKPTEYNLDQIESPPLWQEYTEVPNLSGDQRLINWLNISSFPTFRKLWGKAAVDGSYTLNVVSKSKFGTKSIVLSENSWIGTKNTFLGVFMIVTTILIFIALPLIWKFRM